jgi:hypothetical protein
MFSFPCWIRPWFTDHFWRIVFWVLLFDWVEEGNGRLVDVEREYWEAMSGGIVKDPAAVLRNRERRTVRRRTPVWPLWLPPAIVVGDCERWAAPRLQLNIHAPADIQSIQDLNRLF